MPVPQSLRTRTAQLPNTHQLLSTHLRKATRHYTSISTATSPPAVPPLILIDSLIFRAMRSPQQVLVVGQG